MSATHPVVSAVCPSSSAGLQTDLLQTWEACPSIWEMLRCLVLSVVVRTDVVPYALPFLYLCFPSFVSSSYSNACATSIFKNTPQLKRQNWIILLYTYHRHTWFDCASFHCPSQTWHFFNKLKARPPPAKILQLALLRYELHCGWSRTKPAISPRYACTNLKICCYFRISKNTHFKRVFKSIVIFVIMCNLEDDKSTITITWGEMRMEESTQFFFHDKRSPCFYIPLGSRIYSRFP